MQFLSIDTDTHTQLDCARICIDAHERQTIAKLQCLLPSGGKYKVDAPYFPRSRIHTLASVNRTLFPQKRYILI